MVSEQERNEVNVDKHNVLKSRKTKGYIKAVHYFIRRIVKISKRIIYHRVVEMLEEGQSISKIAKEINLIRLTVYRITILFWFYKLFFNASKINDNNLL